MSTPYYSDEAVTLWHGDALEVLRDLPDASVDCCVTSPPYFGLRDYGVDGQMGLESSPGEYVKAMRALFSEVRRVLADDGTLWLNIGDSYSSSGGKQGVGVNARVGATKMQHDSRTRPVTDLPAKNLLGIPWRVAFALQDDGWILRNDIIWAKPNGMPSSVTDRLATKHEHVFMLSKCSRYWFDLDAIREERAREERFDSIQAVERKGHGATGSDSSDRLRSGGNPASIWNTGTYKSDGRNPGDVWTIATQPFSEAHFATMPVALAARAIKAGCKPGGVVLDPFSGSGTTGLAAARHGRRYVGIDLSQDYLDLSLRTRLAQTSLLDGEAV